MKRFFRRIGEKARDPVQSPVTIVAFGDSVTQGVMEHNELDLESVYHRVLQSELEHFFPCTTFSTVNAGVSGGTVRQALERLEPDVMSRGPDLVLIAFGLNDSLCGEDGLPEFSEGLHSIVHKIREKTEADVLFLTPPFMARRRNGRIHPDHIPMADHIIETQTQNILSRYAQAIREVSRALDVPLADIHKEWERLAAENLDTDVWLVNGLNHPGPKGHSLAASVVFHRLLACRETGNGTLALP